MVNNLRGPSTRSSRGPERVDFIQNPAQKLVEALRGRGARTPEDIERLLKEGVTERVLPLLKELWQIEESDLRAIESLEAQLNAELGKIFQGEKDPIEEGYEENHGNLSDARYDSL